MVPLVEKSSSRNVRRVSWSTKLKLRSSLTVKSRKLQTEIKKQVQTAKNAPEAIQHRAATASKEVAEMQQEWRDSVKVQEEGGHKR